MVPIVAMPMARLLAVRDRNFAESESGGAVDGLGQHEKSSSARWLATALRLFTEMLRREVV